VNLMSQSLPAALAPPVAVGGVGGSGTRIVAQLLQAAGLHMGEDLNPASDTLWFTLLFKRAQILAADEAEFDALTGILASALAGTARFDEATIQRIQALASAPRAPLHAMAWLRERAHSLIQAGTREQAPAGPRRWGWKEPNTHVVIERLWQRLPTLRYVHVVRHGLDMAYSVNQNQLRLWGAHVLGSDGPATPQRSLAYWCHVHRRMQVLLAANPQRMYWLDYDALCRDPIAQAQALCRFLDCDFATVVEVLAQVRASGESRHAGECLDGFDPDDLAYVQSLGYHVGY
jgi:hypothetical protein